MLSPYLPTFYLLLHPPLKLLLGYQSDSVHLGKINHVYEPKYHSLWAGIFIGKMEIPIAHFIETQIG